MRRFGIALLMVLALALVWLLAAVLVARPPEPLPAPQRGFTLDGVNLVEPGGRRVEAARVVVEGARISGVEAGASSAGPFAGGFVLPGFTDMHVHMPATGLPGEAEYTMLLLLSHGVTTARMLGGTDVPTTRALRGRMERGELVGPRVFTCSIWLDGPSPVLPGARSIEGADQARAAVAELAEAGADCVKPYDRLDHETVVALREAAHAANLPMVGHTPQDVALEDARVDDVQHLRGVHPPFEDEGRAYPYLLGPWLRLDEARLSHVIRVSRQHEMSYTPTLSAVEATLRARNWEAWRDSPTMQMWPPQLRDGLWSAEVGFNPTRFMSGADFEMVERAVEQMKRSVRRLHEAGVPLHTGTDCNAPNIVPGESLQRELRLWEDAGVPTEDILVATSVRSPRFLGIERAGSLEPGAPADFAIFREDPTRNLEAVGTLVAVARDGRLYTKTDLDARVARYQAHYQSGAFRSLIIAPLRVAFRAVTAAVGLLR